MKVNKKIFSAVPGLVQSSYQKINIKALDKDVKNKINFNGNEHIFLKIEVQDYEINTLESFLFKKYDVPFLCRNDCSKKINWN